MINGLCVTIPGSEVATKMRERALYHLKRMREYQDTAATLEKVGLMEKDSQVRSSSYNDPLRDARDGITRHERKAREFEYMAQWVDLGETYLLDTNDLTKLGVLSSAY
jgi:hypothetical protein